MTAGTDDFVAAEWRAIGTAIRIVVTDPGVLEAARQLTVGELAELDLACSRFRPDSEVSQLGNGLGMPSRVSPLLAEAMSVALDAAEFTDGDLDPTVGHAMEVIGYDRDLSLLELTGPKPAYSYAVRFHSTWRHIDFDPDASTVNVPAGVVIDLGATAKAWAADRVAAKIHREFHCGVLVSFGGDIATAGDEPAGGWTIRVQEEVGNPNDPAPTGSCLIRIPSGGLATSSTTARRWQRGGHAMHHILDPRTGLPATEVWRTVTIAAPTALAANVAATTTIIRGVRGIAWLAELGHPARLVSADGEVATLNGWPEDVSPS